MERRFAKKTTFIGVLIPLFLLVWFIIRSEICRIYFPEMKVDAKEWDGANNLTMNSFALMFFASFIFMRFCKRNRVVDFMLDVLIGVSLTDVMDRLLFHISHKTDYELLTFVITVIVILIDHYKLFLLNLYYKIRDKINI